MRAQTTLDFAIGASVFLLTVAFVFAFVTGLLAPFDETAQGDTVTADRVADLLSQDLLTEANERYVLNGSCTAALADDAKLSGCGFDGATLRARLDLSADQSINVTVRGRPGPGSSGDELLCWDDESEQAVAATAPACDDDVVLAAGDQIPTEGGSVVTARRVVSVGDTTAAMEVAVW